MTSRLALLAALLALVATLFLVFQGEDGLSADPNGLVDQGTEQTRLDPATAGNGTGNDGKGQDGPEREDLEGEPEEPNVLPQDDEIPSFRGFVLDSGGRPLADVELVALGFTRWGSRYKGFEDRALANWTTVTEPNGSFAFPSPPRDNLKFVISIRHDGFAPIDLEDQPATPGRTRDLGEIRLNHGFRLEGTVVDPRGLPVANAQVLAYRDPLNPKGAQALLYVPPLEGYEATTDQEGQFSFDHLPSGAVRLKASANGYFEAWSGIANAVPDGTASGLEIHLREGQMVRGVTLDQNRRAVANARVLLSSRGNDLEDSYEVETESDERGEFSIPVPADLARAALTAGADGFFLERRSLKANQLTERIELLLSPAPALVGVVVDEAGAAVPGATVRLVEQGENKLDPRSMAANDETIADENGNFTLNPKLRSAWGGRFTVYAWNDKHAVGQSDMFRLSESRNYKAPDLRVVLARGFQASGRVLDPGGRGLAGARVVLRKLRYQRKSRIPSDNPASTRGGDIFATTQSAGDGSFAFPGLSSGDWRLEAHGAGYSPTQSEDFVLIDTDYEATLQLVAEASITGQVNGDRAAFARLRITAQSPGQEMVDTMVDGEGRFHLPTLMPGTWTLELREAESASGNQSFFYGNTPALARADGVEVNPGQESVVTLELSLAGRSRLQGSVRINGESAVGYQVFVSPQLGAEGGDSKMAAKNLRASIRSTEVDFTGSFQISGLDSGDYWVIVTAPGQFPQGIWDASSDGARGLGRQTVSLRDGAESSLRFDILLGSLELVIGNSDGKSSRARLTPSPDDGRFTQSSYLSRRGRTWNDIPSGSYLLEIRQGDGSWSSQMATVPSGGTGQVTVQLPLTSVNRR